MGSLQYQFGNFMIVILVTKLSDAIVIPVPIILGLIGVRDGPRVALKSTGEREAGAARATGTAPSLRAAKSCRGQTGSDTVPNTLHELL